MSVLGPPVLDFDPLKLLNFDLNANKDPAFHSNADPDPASKSGSRELKKDPEEGKTFEVFGNSPAKRETHYMFEYRLIFLSLGFRSGISQKPNPRSGFSETLAFWYLPNPRRHPP